MPIGNAARPWLFVVARRVPYRQRRGIHRFHQLVEKVGSIRQSEGPNPENLIVQREEYDGVLQAASRLSRSDREVFSLAAWEGLPHRDISVQEPPISPTTCGDRHSSRWLRPSRPAKRAGSCTSPSRSLVLRQATRWD